MTSRPSTRQGFTLFEVLAAVAVLALVFTILAEAAIVGLRSEGTDRRRAEAALIADLELGVLESLLASGVPLEIGVTEKEQEPYRIAVEVLPEDFLALLPAALQTEIAASTDDDLASMLVDERGESRIHRLRVVVEWDEPVTTERIVRTTHRLDTSELAALFPADAEPASDDGEDGGKIDEDERSLRERILNDDLESLLEEPE